MPLGLFYPEMPPGLHLQAAVQGLRDSVALRSKPAMSQDQLAALRASPGDARANANSRNEFGDSTALKRCTGYVESPPGMRKVAFIEHLLHARHDVRTDRILLTAL